MFYQTPHKGWSGIESEPRDKPSGLYQDLTHRFYKEACFENLEVIHSTNIRIYGKPTVNFFLHDRPEN
jgi:hypothetical protein